MLVFELCLLFITVLYVIYISCAASALLFLYTHSQTLHAGTHFNLHPTHTHMQHHTHACIYTHLRTVPMQVSSRSHAVLQVVVEGKDVQKASGAVANIKVGKLSLVDLAGSERAANTKNTGKGNAVRNALRNALLLPTSDS